MPTLIGLALLLATSAGAQVRDDQNGGTARIGSGQIGVRQTRDDAPSSIQPTGRIQSRVANRVQSRIRNRIDRYYNPRANAISPFAVADGQARTAGTRPRP
ncbi:hypothetical protein [Sphingomonas sp. TZW2008]|uniref:hypothetical protein n=1 Tax=Sphingomonas sp. TZW2008 TaxID=1917973 RepID=UPI001181A31E|nr:hypothetical protein [Sphingomonas sp. TZW2008]